jgi:hypothetical protein
MPWKLPAPLAGTIEQAGPNGALAAIAPEEEDDAEDDEEDDEEDDGIADELLVEAALLPVEPEAVLAPEDPPQAVRVRARPETAATRAERVRREVFTGGAPSCSVRDGGVAGWTRCGGGFVRPGPEEARDVSYRTRRAGGV